MTSRRQLICGAAAAASLGLVGAVRAAPFPEKPLRLIVPYPTGGGADQWARIVAGKAEKLLGQTIVFDYRPGGSTTIGADATARAPADGYTFHLMDSTAFAYVPNMRKVSYDPLKSFVPLAHLGALPMAIVIHPSVPARNLQELIAYARANPGGIAFNHVPYKGAAQYMADLVGGQIEMAVSTLGPAVAHHQAGRIRALGVSSAKRSSALPDVPSIAEQGFEGFDEKPWNCFVAPAGVPADALERLRSVLRTTIEDPEVVAALRKAGVEEAGTLSVSQVGEQMRIDLQKWGEVIRRANITMDS